MDKGNRFNKNYRDNNYRDYRDRDNNRGDNNRDNNRDYRQRDFNRDSNRNKDYSERPNYRERGEGYQNRERGSDYYQNRERNSENRSNYRERSNSDYRPNYRERERSNNDYRPNYRDENSDYQRRESPKETNVWSRRVRAGNRRTYFFDIHSTRVGDYYLTVTESKKRFDGMGYERHKLHVYKEDFLKFLNTLQDTVGLRPAKLRPEYFLGDLAPKKKKS